jgi:type III secretion protein S
MNYESIVRLSAEALMLCVVLSLPAVIVSALIGLLVSLFQTVTSLQDQSISQGMKLLVVSVVVIASAPWAGSTLMQFSENVFSAAFAK